MTAPPPVCDSTGRPVRLDRLLASGGEGAVYTLAHDPTRLAKVYHADKRTPDRLAKLPALLSLARPKLLDVAAWPTDLVFDAGTRQVIGFLMPRAVDSRLIQELYNPVQRLKSFPRAGWKFQVRAAANLAAAFDEVHAAGCVIGDVNQSNALVSGQALVRLIDCDSFQVRAGGRDYLCDVGVPHYTPPELQGKPLRGLTRTANHDRFGLAVLIYQLLFAGRHPCMGLYRGPGDVPPFDRLIAEYRFAQGPAAAGWGMAPPPHIPTFADIPPDVGTLFRRAFERGSEAANARPTAAEWFAALNRLLPAIDTCKTDPGHTYWRGAGGCVWCRLEARGAPPYYFGVADQTAGFAVDAARLQDVLRRLAACPLVEFPFDRRQFAPPVPPAGRPVPDDLRTLRATWLAARTRAEAAATVRAGADAREVARIDARLSARDEAARAKRAEEARKLEAEYQAEWQETRAERHRQQLVLGLLAAVTGSGFCVIPLGVVHRGFAFAGLMVLVVFGAWLGVYRMMSRSSPGRQRLAALRRQRAEVEDRAATAMERHAAEAEQARAAAQKATASILAAGRAEVGRAETTYRDRLDGETSARRRQQATAETAFSELVKAWSDRVADYRQRHAAADAGVRRAVADCRGLAAVYQTELSRLEAGAEAAARLRHLRLHRIAEAELPLIGSGRTMTLEAHGIVSAADVDTDAIRNIRGFGEKLIGVLVQWRAGVILSFRFDPKTDLPAGELGAAVTAARTRQQQYLAVAEQHLTAAAVATQECRAALAALTSRIAAATAELARATADLDLMILAS